MTFNRDVGADGPGFPGGGDIRFRIDGLNATTSIGHVIDSGDCLAIKGTQAIPRLRAVRLGDADGTLQVTYFY